MRIPVLAVMIRATLALLAITLAATSSVSKAQDLEVIHPFSARSEAMAVLILAQAYDARGGRWVDTALAGGGATRRLTMSRLAASDPPGAFHSTVGPWLTELADERVLGDVADIAVRDGWSRTLPPALMRNITVEGKVVAVPLSMHGINWVWFNRHALQVAGVAPPRSWDELLAAAGPLSRAGFIPFALSSQSWQVSAVWVQILAGIGGQAVYERYIASDPAVFSTPAALSAFEILGRLRGYADSGSTGRSWSNNAALIATGRAAFMFMGDWVKGEFTAAGRSIGTNADIGCMLTPGADNFYMLNPDVLAITSGVRTPVTGAQKKLATVAMSRDVQRRFALAKNAIPSRMDVDIDGFDECAGRALAFRSRPEAYVLSAETALRGEILGAVGDVLAKYWGDPTMTPQQATQAAAAAMRRSM